ncbi:hypothetical protein EJ110_NYTH35964 [Nymphaea thermarum]|nr:hypothetical protein EJ110_NYTH35964 [Nymphaea thermarum]
MDPDPDNTYRLTVQIAYVSVIHYDHSMLLDCLISKDSGVLCVRYLLRCLRIVVGSWDSFVKFVMPDFDTSLSLCKKRKVCLDDNDSLTKAGSSTSGSNHLVRRPAKSKAMIAQLEFWAIHAPVLAHVDMVCFAEKCFSRPLLAASSAAPLSEISQFFPPKELLRNPSVVLQFPAAASGLSVDGRPEHHLLLLSSILGIAVASLVPADPRIPEMAIRITAVYSGYIAQSLATGIRSGNCRLFQDCCCREFSSLKIVPISISRRSILPQLIVPTE